ncbi:hypothetical protein [Pseudoxanthomonas sp.]|uniref:hypothetical protein n=1 Tax=Pseudoxanthomonas sp. TaxID=1871049 RepID=UPI00260915E8|nr:hypothetical protein [Pseudoxanthomonas sp.]WDS34953.1 MAG: hypothetical protein O8I58_11250 [Pseudoxanthomonas sp.]
MLEWMKSLFNPVWYRPENLARVWVRERVGAKLMRLCTVMVVLALCTSFISLPLAGYVDSVGLDAALSMLDLQLSVCLALLMVPVVGFIRRKTPRRRRVSFLRKLRNLRLLRELIATPWYER